MKTVLLRPSVTVAKATDNKGGVTVTLDVTAVVGDAASYNIYRGTAIQPTVTGVTVTCAPLGAAYAKIGSIASDATSFVFNDRTAKAPTTGTTDLQYCYYATTVDANGQESTPVMADVKGPVSAAPVTAATALKFVSGTVTAGAAGRAVLTVVYPDAINAASVQNDDYTVVYTPKGSATSFSLVITSAVRATITKNVDITATLPTGAGVPVPAVGDTYLVTARNGATDSDTVTSGTGTTLLTQPVGDQVQITN